VNLKVEDYYPQGNDFCSALSKRRQRERASRPPQVEELLDQYLKEPLREGTQSPLFPVASGKTGKLSRRALVRTDRRGHAQSDGSNKPDCPRTIRLISFGRPAHEFLAKCGTLEAAQRNRLTCRQPDTKLNGMLTKGSYRDKSIEHEQT